MNGIKITRHTGEWLYICNTMINKDSIITNNETMYKKLCGNIP